MSDQPVFRLTVEVSYPDEPERKDMLLVHERLRSVSSLRFALIQLAEHLKKSPPDSDWRPL